VQRHVDARLLPPVGAHALPVLALVPVVDGVPVAAPLAMAGVGQVHARRAGFQQR